MSAITGFMIIRLALGTILPKSLISPPKESRGHYCGLVSWWRKTHSPKRKATVCESAPEFIWKAVWDSLALFHKTCAYQFSAFQRSGLSPRNIRIQESSWNQNECESGVGRLCQIILSARRLPERFIFPFILCLIYERGSRVYRGSLICPLLCKMRHVTGWRVRRELISILRQRSQNWACSIITLL